MVWALCVIVACLIIRRSCYKRFLTQTFSAPRMGQCDYGIYWYICMYTAHHFILLQLNPLNLGIDREGWWFEYSVSYLRFWLSAKSAKNIFCPWLYLLWKLGSLNMEFSAKFLCRKLGISSGYSSILWALGLIGKDGSLNNLCSSCTFDYQQRLLKTFRGTGNACSEDWIVWLWNILGNVFAFLVNFVLLQLNPLCLSVNSEGW